MSSLKKCLSIIVLILFTASVFALEVDEVELQSAGKEDSIVFVNYEGPHAVIDSLDSIKGLGSVLGDFVSSDLEKLSYSDLSAKYSVIHAFDKDVKEGLDADIIILSPEAGVDHIRNLRHIIASYLVHSYGYSEDDAETIAVFVTVYNAVNRGNLEVFKSKYKKVVFDNLSSAKCGLSVNYEEWPGRTQIVIPLFDVFGGLSSIETSVISDENVVRHMQEDDDMNIESRKELVDIKERESELAAKKAQAAAKEAVETQKQIVVEEEKTAILEEEVRDAEVEAEEAKQFALENPKDKNAQKTAEEKEVFAQKKQQELRTQEDKVEEVKEKNLSAKETASKQQAVADKKLTEAQSERKEIAKDQTVVTKRELENATAPSVYALQLVNDKNLFSKVVKVNANNGNVIKASPLTSIRNRMIYASGANFLAVAGENKGKGAVKLVIINSESLEIEAESEEQIAETSVLVQDGSEYLCVIQTSKKTFAAARFDSNLNLTAKSSVGVKPQSPLTVSGNQLVVTGDDGKLHLLDKNNLSEIN